MTKQYIELFYKGNTCSSKNLLSMGVGTPSMFGVWRLVFEKERKIPEYPKETSGEDSN